LFWYSRWLKVLGKARYDMQGHSYISFECGICGETVSVLTKAHIASHGLTKKEYLKRHPEHREMRFWGTATNDKEARAQHIRDGGIIEFLPSKRGTAR